MQARYIHNLDFNLKKSSVSFSDGLLGGNILSSQLISTDLISADLISDGLLGGKGGHKEKAGRTEAKVVFLIIKEKLLKN